jgi:hypothetical protein
MGETLSELRDKYEAFLRSEVCTCTIYSNSLVSRQGSPAVESLSHTTITPHVLTLSLFFFFQLNSAFTWWNEYRPPLMILRT